MVRIKQLAKTQFIVSSGAIDIQRVVVIKNFKNEAKKEEICAVHSAIPKRPKSLTKERAAMRRGEEESA